MDCADDIPGLIPQPGNVVLGQATGGQRPPGDDAHVSAADCLVSRWPYQPRAMNGNRHDWHPVGDRDDEGAVLELPDGAVRRDPPLRIGQQRVPGRQGPGGIGVDLAEVGRLPVHLDHPDRAHRRTEQRDAEQLAHGQDSQRHRQRPQLHDRVQAGLVIGHHYAGPGRPEVLKAIDCYPRPRGAQPHPRPPPHYPVGDGRVGPGGPAAPHQKGNDQGRQHARGERRHRTPGHPSALPAYPHGRPQAPS